MSADRTGPGAAQANHRAILEAQDELIALSDATGRLVYVNHAYATHCDLTPDEMVGQNLYDHVHASDLPTVRSLLQALHAGGGPISSVNRILSGERTRWVRWTNKLLRDDGAEPLMLSVGHDVTEQRAAEQALADAEQRRRRLYEATPALMHSIDADGHLLDVSDAWLQHFGYTREDVQGRRSIDFLSPDSLRRAQAEVVPMFFRDGRVDNIEYQFVHKDGHFVDVLISAVLEYHADGTPARSLAVMQDISERKRLAAELDRTHAHLDAIVNNVPATLGYWGRDGSTRFANRGFQASLGLPLAQIVGQRLQDIYADADPLAYAAMAPHVDAVLRGERQEFELGILTTDGLRQFGMTLVPDQSNPSQVSGFYGLGYDITGRKSLELRLSESEMRYRALFDHLGSGFALHEVVVDGDGMPVDYTVLAMNGVYAAMMSLDRTQAIGARATELAPGFDGERDVWIRRFGEVALKGVPYQGEHRSGAPARWVEVVAYQPAPGQFALLVQDISQRKAAEAQLKHALAEKDTLLKEVYHRVKNNLQVVQSLLALQRRSVPDGPARVALDDSVQRVRAIALVHEKLYQAGNLASVSLPEYTRDLLLQIGEVAGARQRHIALRSDVAVLQSALDGAIPFGLLVAELVGNAFKHGFSGRTEGEIGVTLTPGAQGAVLSISDDGVGLPADFQLDATRTMGLQLAASLARQLGGELQAHSDPRTGGTTFSAILKSL